MTDAPGRRLIVAMVLASAGAARGNEPATRASDVVTLVEVLELASRDNPRLRAARIEPAVARAQLEQAGLLANPSVSLGYRRVVEGDPQNRFIVGVAMPVDVSGERGARERRARADLRSAEVRADATVLAAATEVRAQFTKLVYLQKVVELRQQALDLAERLVAAARLRQGAGDLSRVGVEQIELALERVRGQLIQAEGALRRERGVLDSLVGGGLPVEFRAAGELAAGRGRCDRAALLARMREERPDLQLLSIAVSQAELDIDAARRSRFPDFDVAVSADVRDPGDTLVGGSIAFPLPVFDRRQGELAAAERAAEVARARQEEGALGAEREVLSLCADIDSAEHFLAHVDLRITPLALRRREALIRGVRLGEVRAEETNLATRELIDIEQASLDAAYQSSVAQLALDAAIGRR